MSDNRGSNINAFLLGMIIGGVLGVLFAPDKGEETRKRLKANWKEWSKKALEMAEGLGEEVPEKLQEEIVPRVAQAAEVVQPIRQLVSEIRPAAEELEGGLKEWVQPIAESVQEVKRDLNQAVGQAQTELKNRGRRVIPRFFRGV